MNHNIHDLFRTQAKQTPDSIAITDGRRQYTYTELDKLTDRVAARLYDQGVRPETIVGCWLPESFSTVIAVLGVLKAGGGYLLLDRHLPNERLRYMITDANPLCIVGDEAPPDRLAGDRPVLLLGEIITPAEDVTPPEPIIGSDSLAYVAYTSGSTGRPKGVMITHGATTSHAQAFSKLFNLRPGDRAPLMAPAAFDMATEEMIPPLLSGCTLIDAPDTNSDIATFNESVLKNHFTFLNLAAPQWHQWTTYLHENHLPIPAGLRFVIVGSDKIYTAKFQEWQSLPGAEKVWWVAAYGVTEATVTSTFYLTAATDDLSHEPIMPIGTPMAHVTTHVVANDGREVGAGETGELYIGGAGLARGYLNLPQKTAENFIPDRFSNQPGHYLYRTGDLVRLLANGAIVWLGRKDSQVKINGLRIEPAEIEAVIQEYPGADEAIVTLDTTAAGASNRLIAFVVPEPDHILDLDKLKSHLKNRLHPLMVPSEFRLLRSIPLNANGKIDRKALEEYAKST